MTDAPFQSRVHNSAILAGPPCQPWCDKQHERADGWDVVSDHAAGIEMVKWCSRTIKMPTSGGSMELDVYVGSSCWADTAVDDGAVHLDEVRVQLEPYELTTQQARALAHTLLALVEVTS